MHLAHWHLISICGMNSTAKANLLRHCEVIQNIGQNTSNKSLLGHTLTAHHILLPTLHGSWLHGCGNLKHTVFTSAAPVNNNWVFSSLFSRSNGFSRLVISLNCLSALLPLLTTKPPIDPLVEPTKQECNRFSQSHSSKFCFCWAEFCS